MKIRKTLGSVTAALIVGVAGYSVQKAPTSPNTIVLIVAPLVSAAGLMTSVGVLHSYLFVATHQISSAAWYATELAKETTNSPDPMSSVHYVNHIRMGYVMHQDPGRR